MTSPDLGMSKMTSALFGLEQPQAASDFQRGYTALRLKSKFCKIRFYSFSQNFSQIGILEPFQIAHFWFKTCTLGGGCFGLKIFILIYLQITGKVVFLRGHLVFFKPGLESDS